MSEKWQPGMKWDPNKHDLGQHFLKPVQPKCVRCGKPWPCEKRTAELDRMSRFAFAVKTLFPMSLIYGD